MYKLPMTRTKQLCDSFLKMGVPGFDIVAYHRGECILRYQGGYSDLKNKIPVKGNERYNVYSISKPITVTAAMQLWEKGLFQLSDRLDNYMPEFAEMTVKTPDGIVPAKNPILVQNLFEMSAGFSYDLKTPNLLAGKEALSPTCPTREMMRYLAKDPLLYHPGENWRYSSAHDVLAALVEVVSGERFEEYVKKNIFDPLLMTNSTFLLPESERKTLACHYCFNRETGEITEIGPNNGYMFGSEYASGGAGCVTTVDDYIKFAEALRTGKLVKPETLKLMTTDRLQGVQVRSYSSENIYGYGLGLRCHKAGEVRTDFGWGGAAGSYLAIDLENELSVFHAQHMLNSPNQGIRRKVYEYVMADLTEREEFIRMTEEPLPQINYTLTY